ncbi:MAG TPA: hypothetical protein VGK67_11540 [Myxococcales bacterium]
MAATAKRRALLEAMGRRVLYEGMLASLYQRALEKLESLGFDEDTAPLQESLRQKRAHAELLRRFASSEALRTERGRGSEGWILEEAVASARDAAHVLRILELAETENEGGWEHLADLAVRAGEGRLAKASTDPLAEERLEREALRRLIKRAEASQTIRVLRPREAGHARPRRA